MKTISSIGRRDWLLLLGLLAAFVALVLLAPPEKTLGEAIRTVYVHVALTRAGIWGFYVAGLLGLAVAITARERLQEWTRVVTWVSLALFFAGGIGSIFAQQSSWGGLLWEEPRNRTSLSVIAVALAVLVLIQWIPWIRVRGLLAFGLAGYVAWIIPRTPLVFHPANAIGSSPSAMIRWAFLALTLIACLIGVWFVWVLGRGER
ncbi:MAG: hypothetical protein JSV68_05970 [Anaerolineaceae bacterium]|nr:MAG: hypothetical protein JSV68_05970 [Anaerolineaceae bacterium]